MIPKRSDERTRTNKTGSDGIALKKGVALDYSWTEPSWDWEEPVRRYYLSFQESGMQAYFQQTDVEQLWLACQFLNQVYTSGRPSAMILSEAMKMMQGLGATEGERRQLKIELEKEAIESVDTKEAKVTELKNRLKKA